MPKKSQFSEKQKEAIRLQAIEFFEAAGRTMQPVFEAVNDYERMWRVQLPKTLEEKYKERTDMAALVPTDIYKNLRSIRAGLRRLLFSRKPYASIVASGQPTDRKENIIKAEWTLQGMLDIQSNGRGYEFEADKAMHQALYSGISCTFTQWVKQTERKPVRDPESNRVFIGEDGHPEFTDEVVAEYAETKALDIRRVRIDPSAETADDIRIVGFQSIVQLSDLLKLNRDPNSFYDFDETELSKSSFQHARYYEHITGEIDAYADKGKENPNFADKPVEKWETRGLFRTEHSDGSMEFNDLVVALGNRDQLLGIKHNDLPINGWELFDFPVVDHELSRMYTMGLVEPVMDAFVEKFVKRNQSLDESSRRTYDMYVGDESACQDLPDTIERENGKILLVNTLAAGAPNVSSVLAPIPRQGTGQDTFNQSVALSDEIQDGMGLNDFTGGTDPRRQETATAVTALVAGGASLTEQIAVTLKDSMLSPNWRKQLILWDFFKGHTMNKVRDGKGDIHGVSPGDLDFFYKIDVEIATALDKPTMQRRWTEQLPLMLQDPFLDPYEVRKMNIEILGLPNADRILPPNQHLQDIIERENIALVNGLQIFVSEFDQHQAHIEGHSAAIDQALQMGLPTDTLEAHIAEHEQAIEQANAGLGNTKEVGGLNNQAISNENASNTFVPGKGQRQRIG